MTDERLDERIRDAFAEVELSKEAEDRILANLLSAEKDAWRAEEPAREQRPARAAFRHRRWIAPLAAAAALVAVAIIGGAQLMPSSSATSDKAAAPMEAMDAGTAAGGYAAESAVENEAAEAADAARAAGTATVVLEDGSRYAIIGPAADAEEPKGYAWQDATVEATGDACVVAVLEDGTALVRFEGEDVLYQAAAL